MRESKQSYRPESRFPHPLGAGRLRHRRLRQRHRVRRRRPSHRLHLRHMAGCNRLLHPLRRHHRGLIAAARPRLSLPASQPSRSQPISPPTLIHKQLMYHATSRSVPIHGTTMHQHRLGKKGFTTSDAYAFAREMEKLHPDNRHVKDKPSRTEPSLRDAARRVSAANAPRCIPVANPPITPGPPRHRLPLPPRLRRLDRPLVSKFV